MVCNDNCETDVTLSFEFKMSICKTKKHLIVAIAQYFSILLIKKHEEEFLKRIHEKLIERYPFLFEKITIYHLIFIFWLWAKKSSSSYLLKIWLKSSFILFDGQSSYLAQVWCLYIPYSLCTVLNPVQL